MLWALWDPIGAGVPLDEYDTYVPSIWKLLDEGAGVDAVAAELTRIRVERIGMDAGTDQATAERLTEWWYWRFEFPEEFKANS